MNARDYHLNISQKKIAFILDHELHDYRIPFFNLMNENCAELTVIHTGKIKASDFKQIIVNKYTMLGVEYRGLPGLYNYDIVVYMQNIRMVNLWLATFNPFKKYTLYHWGIGTSSSRGLSSQSNIVGFLRNLLTKYSRGLVLYSKYPIKQYHKDLQYKISVAPNTVHSKLSCDLSKSKKDSFLFIGGLNKRKGLEDLFDAYRIYLSRLNGDVPYFLLIVGDGPEKKTLEQLAKALNIEQYVKFKGLINNDVEKKELFKRSICSFSPKQAGLSVLESFSFGVPFISYKSAISGGEHLNITDSKTGFLVNDKHDMSNIMTDISKGEILISNMGENAYKYYQENRKIEHMYEGFIDAFKL